MATGLGNRVRVSGSSNAYIDMGFSFDVMSYSIEDGTTTLSWAATLISSGISWYNWEGTWSLEIPGANILLEGTFETGEGNSTRDLALIADGTIIISHNEEGLFANKAWEFTLKGDSTSFSRTVRCSNTMTLDPVPRWSFLTAPNFTDEQNPTVTYTLGEPKITEAYLGISFDNAATDAIPYRAIPLDSTSYTFNFTNAEREILRENTVYESYPRVSYVLKVKYKDKYYYHQKYCRLDIINDQQELTAEVKDINPVTVSLTGDENVLVKYCSNIEASLTAFPKKHAILETYYIKNGTTRINSAYHVFEGAENSSFYFYTKDSRSNVVTQTIDMPLVDYIKPTVNIGGNRPDTSGKLTLIASGNYFNQSFGAVNNSLTVEYRYKVDGDDSFNNWTQMSVSISENTYTATVSLSGLDYRANYTFEVRAVDKLLTISSEKTGVQSIPVFDWSKEDFNFNCDVRIKGDLRLKGDGNYGNKLSFGDGDYAYIHEPTDDDLEIKATDLTLNATNININGSNLIRVNDVPLPVVSAGTWEPMVTENSILGTYEVRQGWYYRVGNVCTIGWNIKVNVVSGDTANRSKQIKIANAPYFPAYATAGGGICHNAYVSDTTAQFSGWVIGDDGGITPRAGDNNSNILEIISAVCFPAASSSYGSKLLTLMGSITYQIQE